jgi:nitroreductase
MMELSQLMKERRSVYVFEDREVEVGLVGELLDASIWVPNHGMTQPWRFIVVTGEGRQAMAEANRALAGKWEQDADKKAEKGQKAFDTIMSVPLFLTVVMKEDPRLGVREEDYASTCCIIQNFSLLAWERGIGVVWKTYRLMHQPEFRDALAIMPGEKVVGVLHVGYPAKIPTVQPRIAATDRMTVIRGTEGIRNGTIARGTASSGLPGSEHR